MLQCVDSVRAYTFNLVDSDNNVDLFYCNNDNTQSNCMHIRLYVYTHG